MLLHAKARWPSCVHLCLWPYALCNAVHVFNTAPVLDDGTSRLERFSGISVGYCMKHNHTFGCPVFALQNDLAAGNKIPKWSPRARLGMNLGPSPSHARNVNLVLNLTTGLVSLQFHCRFDDFFETTHLSTRDVNVLSSWKQLTRFVKYDGTPDHSERLARSRNQRVGPIGTITLTAPSSVAQEEVSFTNDISAKSSDMPVSEGASQPADQPSTSAGISSRGHARTMSRAMQDSVSQRSFYGKSDMHYMPAMPVCT
jgi:hypothetical protein